MRWSRRRVAIALGFAPIAGCARFAADHTPPRIAEVEPLDLPPTFRRKLDSGPDFYVAEDHSVPVVELAVAVRAGHASEPPGLEGLVTTAGALLMQGMQGGDEHDLRQRYGELGATPSLSVHRSLLVLHCAVRRDDAGSAIALMVNHMRRATLSDEGFERVRDALIDRLESSRGDPGLVASLGVHLGVFGVEPPVSLLPLDAGRTMDALDVDTVREWLSQHVRPDMLAFFVTGDVHQLRISDAIDDALRDWPLPSEAPPRVSPSAIASGVGPRTVLVPWHGLTRAVLAIGARCSPVGESGEPAQAVARSYLHGRLNSELRGRLRASYGVRSHVSETRVGTLHILSAMLDPMDVGRALQRARGHVLRLQREDLDISAFDFEVLIRAHILEHVHDLHGPRAALTTLLKLADRGLRLHAPSRRIEALTNLRSREVLAAARRMYDPDHVHFCVVGDEETIEHARLAGPKESVAVRHPPQLFGIEGHS